MGLIEFLERLKETFLERYNDFEFRNYQNRDRLGRFHKIGTPSIPLGEKVRRKSPSR